MREWIERIYGCIRERLDKEVERQNIWDEEERLKELALEFLQI